MAAGDGMLWWDGFDAYTGTNEWDEMYTVDNSGTRAVYGAGEGTVGSSYSRHSTGNGLYINNTNRMPNIALGGNFGEVIVGVSMRELHTTTTFNRFQFWDGTTLQVYIRWDYNDRIFRAYNGDGTLLGASSAIPYGLNNSVGYVEVRVLFSATVGEVEMRFNGNPSPIMNLTNKDTINSANTTCNTLSFGAGPCYLDDLYVCRGDTGDFLGDVRIESLVPTGNGNYSQGTGSDGNSTDNYLLVDETDPNEDTDYVSFDTAAEKDSYALANMTQTAGTVYGVGSMIRARKDDGGTRTMRPLFRLSGTDQAGTAFTLSTSYLYWKEFFTTKPGGGAYAVADVNNLEGGVELVS